MDSLNSTIALKFGPAKEKYKFLPPTHRSPTIVIDNAMKVSGLFLYSFLMYADNSLRIEALGGVMGKVGIV